jgi:hypothetical protein
MRATIGSLGRPRWAARVIINSPCRACSATLRNNGSAGSVLVSMLSGRESSIAALHTGQIIRHPSIQLRKRVPRVNGSAWWRLMQHLHTCIGRTDAIRRVGRLRPRDCVIFRITRGSYRNTCANRCWS